MDRQVLIYLGVIVIGLCIAFLVGKAIGYRKGIRFVVKTNIDNALKEVDKQMASTESKPGNTASGSTQVDTVVEEPKESTAEESAPQKPTVVIPKLSIGEVLIIGRKAIFKNFGLDYSYLIPLRSRMGTDDKYIAVEMDDISFHTFLSVGAVEKLLSESNGDYAINETVGVSRMMEIKETWLPPHTKTSMEMIDVIVEDYIKSLNLTAEDMWCNKHHALSEVFPKVDKKRFKALDNIIHIQSLSDSYNPSKSTVIGYLKEHTILDGQIQNIVAENVYGGIYKADMYEYVSEAERNSILESIAFTSSVDIPKLWEQYRNENPLERFLEANADIAAQAH